MATSKGVPTQTEYQKIPYKIWGKVGKFQLLKINYLKDTKEKPRAAIAPPSGKIGLNIYGRSVALILWLYPQIACCRSLFSRCLCITTWITHPSLNPTGQVFRLRTQYRPDGHWPFPSESVFMQKSCSMPVIQIKTKKKSNSVDIVLTS